MAQTELPTSEVLNLTGDYIERFGWEKADGWFAKYGEPACIDGALKAVCAHEFGVGKVEHYFSAVRSLKRYLGVRVIFRWNDSEARDAQHVVETLRAAAIAEAAREDAALLAEAGRSA